MLKPRAIVIEGPDGMGKSTLAAKLGNILGRPVVHRSRPNRSLVDMLETMDDALYKEQAIVWDRLPVISEIVYGQTLRDRSLFTSDDLREYFRNWRPTLLFCRTKDGKPIRHVVKETDTVAHLTALNQKYDQVVKAYDALFFDLKRIGCCPIMVAPGAQDSLIRRSLNQLAWSML